MTEIWTDPSTWANGNFVTAAALREQLYTNSLFLKSPPFATALMTSILNTTSATFVEITGTSASITTQGGKLMITVCGTFSNDTVGAANYFDIAVDGTRVGDSTTGLTQIITPVSADYPDCLSMFHITPVAPSAGSHTVSAYWKMSSGEGATLLRLSVGEFL